MSISTAARPGNAAQHPEHMEVQIFSSAMVSRMLCCSPHQGPLQKGTVRLKFCKEDVQALDRRASVPHCQARQGQHQQPGTEPEQARACEV